jgi:leucyl/phenylalanyl-tRNA--protein transferase
VVQAAAADRFPISHLPAAIMPVFLLSDKIAFPPPHFATPEGLLAVGGDLSRERLLLAYRMGIFPWYAEDEPILWWSPDPRLVLFPKELHVSRTLKRVMRTNTYKVTFDTVFDEVISGCADARLHNAEGTWILEEMVEAYRGLHRAGYAHSAETWREGRLVGGLYGVSLGRCFFGESMFSRESNASSVALVTLVNHLQSSGFDMVDCQVATAHLMRFGAREIPRSHFIKNLRKSLTHPTMKVKWCARFADRIPLLN